MAAVLHALGSDGTAQSALKQLGRILDKCLQVHGGYGYVIEYATMDFSAVRPCGERISSTTALLERPEAARRFLVRRHRGAR